jgi:hypothetical protein
VGCLDVRRDLLHWRIEGFNVILLNLRKILDSGLSKKKVRCGQLTSTTSPRVTSNPLSQWLVR